MPNPYPGMNPYLENRSLWPDVHTMLITGLRIALSRRLPQGFSTKIEQRVYIANDKRNLQPDVFVVGRSAREAEPKVVSDSSVATLARPMAVPVTGIRLSFDTIRVRERFIEIRTTDAQETLIAVVELLSPTNKEDERGRFEYLRKQEILRNSDVHLIEVDLLRAGKWTIAPLEEETREALGAFDYIVSLRYGGSDEVYDLWPISLRSALPTIQVPLTEVAGAIPVDLQEVFHRAYEDARYDRQIDYHREPVPSLHPEDALWSDVLLREKGFR